MWCQQQPVQCHDHGYNHHHQGESMHHDFPHYSANHQQCFHQHDTYTPQNQPQPTDYSNYCCHDYQHCIVDPENHDHSNHHGHSEFGHGWMVATTDQSVPGAISSNDRSRSSSQSPHLHAEILSEITAECEHLLSRAECDKCTIRDETGGEQAINITDLVDIVIKTAECIKESPAADATVLTRKREQNKLAAAKYRDRVKARSMKMSEEREGLEEKNKKLKTKVADLQKEVDDMRKQLLAVMTNL